VPKQLDRQNGDQQVEVKVVDLDPTLRGYHVAWNYGTRYWLPLLGSLPWAVWQTLLSFCFGDRDTCWPSISLIADIAARGERSLITGRWRGKGDTRQRRPGALEILQEAGLLAIETQHSGSQTRYRFHVLKEPPLLAPDQLAKLSPRLQQSHAELLARCGLDQETYPQLVHTLSLRGAQDTTPDGHDSTPAGQDSTNKYKEERLIEEVRKSIKNALKPEISTPNYQTYITDTQATVFDRDTGTLVVAVSSPQAATQLNNYFAMTIRRAIATTNATVHGVPIAGVEFIPRAEGP